MPRRTAHHTSPPPAASLGTRLLRAIEERFPAASRYELFTGYLSERNISLYRRLGYERFRKEVVLLRLRLVYLEKFREWFGR